jgi:hypothetical protein
MTFSKYSLIAWQFSAALPHYGHLSWRMAQRDHVRVSCGTDLCMHYAPDAII